MSALYAGDADGKLTTRLHSGNVARRTSARRIIRAMIHGDEKDVT